MSRRAVATTADGAVRPGMPFGLSVPVGAAVVAVACLCSGLLARTDDARLWLPAVAVAAAAYVSRDLRAALTVAGIAFLLVDGFLENRFGELSWHAGDVGRLAVLVALAVVGTSAGAVVSAAQRRRERVQRLSEIEVWANAGPQAATTRPRVLPVRPGGAS